MSRHEAISAAKTQKTFQSFGPTVEKDIIEKVRLLKSRPLTAPPTSREILTASDISRLMLAEKPPEKHLEMVF